MKTNYQFLLFMLYMLNIIAGQPIVKRESDQTDEEHLHHNCPCHMPIKNTTTKHLEDEQDSVHNDANNTLEHVHDHEDHHGIESENNTEVHGDHSHPHSVHCENCCADSST